MPFVDPNETFEYRHPTWDEDSFMIFKANRDSGDVSKSSRMMSSTEVEYNEDDAMAARLNGEKYSPKFRTETHMSGQHALILSVLVDWGGPEFEVPDYFTNKLGQPHPLIGRKAPISIEWLKHRDPQEIDDIDLMLNIRYKRMTPEEVERFRARRRRVDGPTDGADTPVASGAS